MAEYIEREAALVICEKEYQERIRMSDWCGDTVAWNIGHEIKAIPSAEVQPVRHGRWIKKRVPDEEFRCEYRIELRCSCCDEEGLYMSPYCPNCGASMMDGGET